MPCAVTSTRSTSPAKGAWLNKDGENVVVSIDNQERGRVPLHTIGGITGFGRVLISPPLLGACCEAGITINHMTEEGRFLARVEGPVSGNVLLRRTQYRWADDAARRDADHQVDRRRQNPEPARRAHPRHARSRRTRPPTLKLPPSPPPPIASPTSCGAPKSRSTAISCAAPRARPASSISRCSTRLVRGDKPCFAFKGRSRRPPLDATNALLSFVYALLTSDVRGALEEVGLDPAVGYLHVDRPGRPSLALDLMEEFRPFFADRLALSLINRRQLSHKDFKTLDNGATLLTDEGRKTVLVAYQERKRDEILHPFLDEKVTVGLLWFIQAQLLARAPARRPRRLSAFIWK